MYDFSKFASDSDNKYIPLLRPVNFASLPSGVSWEYVEAPAMPGLARRPDLVTSKHRFGVIRTARPLTAEECEHFDLKPV